MKEYTYDELWNLYIDALTLQEFHKKSNSEYVHFRTKHLQEIIPHKIAERERKAGIRVYITWALLSLFCFLFFLCVEKITIRSVIIFLLSSSVIGAALLLFVYVIASFTFCKNIEEHMEIELMKQELQLLTKNYD